MARSIDVEVPEAGMAAWLCVSALYLVDAASRLVCLVLRLMAGLASGVFLLWAVIALIIWAMTGDRVAEAKIPTLAGFAFMFFVLTMAFAAIRDFVSEQVFNAQCRLLAIVKDEPFC